MLVVKTIYKLFYLYIFYIHYTLSIMIIIINV